MSLFLRLRQSCRRDLWASVDGDAKPGRGACPGLNRVYLSGVLAADPQPDVGRDGEPVTLLLVAFPAPDAKDTEERTETASCEVEVPERVVGPHPKELRVGGLVLFTGQLTGGGGVIATEIHTGPV
jgi:hypothetical protein